MKSKFIIFVLSQATLGFLTGITTGNKNDNSNSPTDEPEDLSEVKRYIRNPAVTDCARIEAARNLTSCRFRESTALVFSTVDYEANRVSSGPRNVYRRGSFLTDIAEVKEMNVCTIAVDAFFDAIRIAQPEASSTVKKILSATYTELRRTIAGVNDGIELISKKQCSDIPIEIEKLQNETSCSAVNMMKSIYVAILNGRNSSSKIGAELSKARKESSSLITELIHSVFDVTKFGLLKTIPDLHFQGFDCPSSIMTLENKAFGKLLALVDSVYSAINVVFRASSEKLTDNYGHY